MDKAYFLLIGALVILALVTGGYAFYKSSSSVSPEQTATPTVQPITPGVPPAKNQIALTIISPKNGAQLSGPSVQVTGKTAPLADVSVNEFDLKADASGNFTATMTLDEGDNYLLVTAVDDTGAIAESELTVTYNPLE